MASEAENNVRPPVTPSGFRSLARVRSKYWRNKLPTRADLSKCTLTREAEPQLHARRGTSTPLRLPHAELVLGVPRFRLPTTPEIFRQRRGRRRYSLHVTTPHLEIDSLDSAQASAMAKMAMPRRGVPRPKVQRLPTSALRGRRPTTVWKY